MRKVIVLGGLALISCVKENPKNTDIETVDSTPIVLADTDIVDDVYVVEEKEIMENKYIDNSLETGATPYAKYYGGNKKCKYDCSEIKVRTSDSDVLVLIKNKGKVVRHAYIQGYDRYTFSIPNGTYQVFFYYGKGWDPEKVMKNGELKGGFVANEDFQKDEPQKLFYNSLEYELVLQQNGNFNTRTSDSEEAL